MNRKVGHNGINRSVLKLLQEGSHGGSVVKIEAVCSSETLVSTYMSTRRYNPEAQHGNCNKIR
jgi:hypothetical protein